MTEGTTATAETMTMKEKVDHMEGLVLKAKADVGLLVDGNNKSAAARVRKLMQELKKLAQELRVEAQERKEAIAPKAKATA